jgi:hypothetical protein
MMNGKPLCIDLFSGLHGWGDAFVSEGWKVVAFDLVDMCSELGLPHPPGISLVIQDVLTIHGSHFKSADCLVCSPPCQEFSYMAMPWSRAKQIELALRGEGEFPAGYTGSRTVAQLTALFDACFRIQREASEATAKLCPDCHGSCTLNRGNNATFVRDFPCERCEGKGKIYRHIPLIVENVRGAVKWVSQPVRWNFGSYYLWGDVPALMPLTLRAVKSGRPNRDGVMAWTTGRIEGYWDDVNGQKQPGRNFHAFENGLGSSPSFNGASHETRGVKTVGHANIRDGQKGIPHRTAGHWTNPAEHEGTKEGGDWWNKECRKTGMARFGSKSSSRKAASAMIAKIPLALAQHIARTFKPLDAPEGTGTRLRGILGGQGNGNRH